MKSFLAFAAALLMPALSSGAALPLATTERELSLLEIVGGVEAATGEFPYIVGITLGGSHYCGGVLLDSTTVVTAAHCSGNSASSYRVRAGSNRWASGGTQVGVSRILVHPSYNSNTINNDIAIWTLSSPIAAGGNVAYVRLPAQGSDPAAGSILTTAGWGLLSESGNTIPATLRKVDVPTVSRTSCNSAYGGGITTNMICAGYSTGGRDACSGDSGGPIVNSAGVLVGLVSWGYGCADPDYPGVYTRVGNYVSWINAN